jgi:TP901 family phage tail tape measure protein
MAKDASIKVMLEFQSNNASLSKATKGIANELSGLQRRTATVASSMASFVPSFAAVGAAAFSAFSFAGRAAVQFQDSFAGVRKTLTFTGTAAKAQEANFKSLSKNLIDLSRTTPMAANELARIGEIGGQLGISAGAITNFTKTISQLTVATTMSAEEASFALSRLAAITRLPERNLGNLASVLVRLGNEFAATESEIVNTAMKIASALEVLESSTSNTAADSLALAAALKQVGQQTQAGSTAVARSLDIMATAVMEGGRELSIFAKVANMTSESFAKLAQAAPAQAFVAFLDGLQQVGNAGANTVQLLEELGLGQQRTLRALRSMALASGDVREAMKSANEEFAVNNALQTEAEKRYETVVSQLGILRNNVNALGIEVGNNTLGPINELVDMLTTIAGGTTQQDLKNIAGRFIGIALAVNTLVTSLRKMQQLNQVAMSAGMMGTGMDNNIRLFGDGIRGFGERDNMRNAANLLASDQKQIEFNRQSYLAQQASLGRNTAGMTNILNAAQTQGIDMFDTAENKRVLDMFGGQMPTGDPSELTTIGDDGTEQQLAAKDQDRIRLMQALNAEEAKNTTENKKQLQLEEEKRQKLAQIAQLEDKIANSKNKQTASTSTQSKKLEGIVGKLNTEMADAPDIADFESVDDQDLMRDMRMEGSKLNAALQNLEETERDLKTATKELNGIQDQSSQQAFDLRTKIEKLNQELDENKFKVNKVGETLKTFKSDVKGADNSIEQLHSSLTEVVTDFQKLDSTAEKTGPSVKEDVDGIKVSVRNLRREVEQTDRAIDKLNVKQARTRFVPNSQSIAGEGSQTGLMRSSFGRTAREIGPVIKGLAGYNAETAKNVGTTKALLKVLTMKRKALMQNKEAMLSSAQGSQAFKVATQSLGSAIMGLKAAIVSLMASMGIMIATTAIFSYLMKLWENSKKTASAIREIGDEIKAVIDLQDQMTFSGLQRDLIQNALDEELQRATPDQALIDTYTQQLADMDKGIAQAAFNIDKSTAELGKSLLLDTTEKGINVEARLEAINQALGTTFDLEEYFVMVGRQIQDFENSTTNSLLTAVQNFDETQQEIDDLRSQNTLSADDRERLKLLEDELVASKLLTEFAQQAGNDFESIIAELGDGFGIMQDSFTGSLIFDTDTLNDNVKDIGLQYEIINKNGEEFVQVFQTTQKEFTTSYGQTISELQKNPLFTILKDDIDGADIEAAIDQLQGYVMLAEVTRRQGVGNVESLGESNSTFIKMQNEGLIKQMNFLKQNGVMMQDIDPIKDRERAIREVSNASRVYQQQQIAQAQQSAKSLGILEFQMTKFEKSLNESLQRSSGNLATVFGGMPETIRKSVDRMLEEMVIKETRLKNFQNDVKRLSTIAPMLAKDIAEQGLAAEEILDDLLKDPVAAFTLEASLTRVAPFKAEDLGISEQEIEKMQQSGLIMGENAAEGIIMGIQNNSNQLEQVFVGTMKNAIDATRYYIKEGSPSKLTAEVLGEPLAQGIALGIFNEDGTIKDALTTVISDAIDEGKVLLMTIPEAVSGLTKALNMMFAVTGAQRAVTAANYAVQKSEQALMATRRKNATLSERILKNQIALQKAELEGRKNNITMTEELNILQQKISIDQMKRDMSGKKSASERKAIADAEKELEELRLAAEAGIVDALDVEVAEEKLAELKGTNKTIDEQRVEILKLAEAEKKLQETEKEAREVDQELISLREENIALLDEAANSSYELQTAYDQLDASTENVFTAEMKYADARDKFADFAKSSPELFDALVQGYGGVGSTIDQIRQKTNLFVESTESGADRAIEAIRNIVTEANAAFSHVQSLDLLGDTSFESAGDDAMNRRNAVATAEEFNQLFEGTALEPLLKNFRDGAALQNSAVRLGKTSGQDRSVFESLDDYTASQQALGRIQKGQKVTFSDYTRAMQSFLGIATNLDSSGQINFSQQQLEGLGIADTSSIPQAEGSGASENYGATVLGGTGMQLGNMGDLSRLADNEKVTYNYKKDTGLGINQKEYNLKVRQDLIDVYNRAKGTNIQRVEQILEDLGMPGYPLGTTGANRGKPVNPTTGSLTSPSDDHRLNYQDQIGRGNQRYINDLYSKVMAMLDSLGDKKYGYVLKRKYGGNVKPFQRALVGEYGPEFVTAMPGGGLRVTPEGSERGGNITVGSVNVNVTGVPTDPIQARKAAVQIQKALVNLEKEGVSGSGLSRR